MFHAVICTVKTGRVQRQAFNTWSEARQYVDFLTGLKGCKIRAFVERVETPRPVVSRPGRSLAA